MNAQTPQWLFPTHARGTEWCNPIEQELFKNQNINLSETLVRECLQNSLDAARSKKQQVRVKFSFQSLRSTDWTQHPLFQGLIPHLQAAGQEFLEVPDASEEIRLLVIEDFGTTGLQGDPTIDKPGDRGGQFFHFFRATGVASKAGDRMGRWGLGKVVFHRASLLRMFWAYTVRGDNAKLLMGKALFSQHEVAGRNCESRGYFGITPPNDQLVLPASDKDFLEEVLDDLGTTRQPYETGLSVVIPHFDPAITAEKLAAAVIAAYYYPILAESLEVVIDHDDVQVVLNASTIIAEAERHLDRQKQSDALLLMRMAQEVLSLDEARRLILPMVGAQRSAPSWKSTVVPEDCLPLLIDRVLSGELVALRIPVKVNRKGRTPLDGHFDVYLKLDPDVKRPVVQFVRDGITPIEIKHRVSRPIQALVITENNPLAALLGDSENPNHTDWQQRGADKLKLYDNGPTTVGFVVNSVRELCELLLQDGEKEDYYALNEFFSIPAPLTRSNLAERKTKEKPDQPDETVVEPPKPPKATVRDMDLTQYSDGFRVAGFAPTGTIIIGRVAFDVSRGDAFEKYHRLDFDLSDTAMFSFVEQGLRVVSRSQSRFEAIVDERDFDLRVTGFDENRDLRVKTKFKSGEAVDGSESI